MKLHASSVIFEIELCTTCTKFKTNWGTVIAAVCFLRCHAHSCAGSADYG